MTDKLNAGADFTEAEVAKLELSVAMIPAGGLLLNFWYGLVGFVRLPQITKDSCQNLANLYYSSTWGGKLLIPRHEVFPDFCESAVSLDNN